MVEQILLTYYKKSFQKILGVSFPDNFCSAKKFRNLIEYLQKNLSLAKVASIKSRFNFYYNEISPFIKTQPLLEFLKNHDEISTNRLVDFGCGRGYVLKYLTSHLKSLKLVCGIDSDLTVLSSCRQILKRIPLQACFYTGLKEAMIFNGSYDLIVTVHALHHITDEKQREVIDGLYYLLRTGGILYIYEDSWTDNNQLLQGGNFLDKKFGQLSTEQKRELFKQNEYWSNYWCYGRHLHNDALSYRSLEDWIKILSSKAFKILAYGVNGFNRKRLHGVPSAWIIAKAYTKSKIK